VDIPSQTLWKIKPKVGLDDSSPVSLVRLVSRAPIALSYLASTTYAFALSKSGIRYACGDVKYQSARITTHKHYRESSKF
jgi:hypothetical protein